MESNFEKAQKIVIRNRDRISKEHSLSLYGLYKQATIGVCNISKPSFLEFEANAKWEAWSTIGNEISSETAIQLYIELVDRLGLEILQENNHQELAAPTQTNLREVSTFAREAEISEKEKTGFDWVREGNLEKLKNDSTLDNHLKLRDENEMTLLHWACDRGHPAIISYLLSIKNRDFLDAQDQDGNTALHLAFWADHRECIDILLSNDARFDIPNRDGETFTNLTSTV